MTKKTPYKGPGADSEEKHEPVSDIDIALVDSLKALDLKRPIREADVGVTAVRPGAAEQQKYRNGFEIDDHLSVRSPLLLNGHLRLAVLSLRSIRPRT